MLGPEGSETFTVVEGDNESLAVHRKAPDDSASPWTNLTLQYAKAEHGGESTFYGVAPPALPPGVELTLRARGSDVLRLYGPPESINLNDSTSLRSKAESLARDLDLPGSRDDDGGGAGDVAVQWERHDRGIHFPLFLGQEACLGSTRDGGCNRTALVSLECTDCVTLVRTVEPRPSQRIASEYPDALQVGPSGANRALFLFLDDGEEATTGDLVAARLHMHLELNASTLRNPDDARGSVVDAVYANGYKLGTNDTYIDNPGLRFPAKSSRAEPEGVRYHWKVRVEPGAYRQDPEPIYDGDIQQDAVTGEVLTADFTPAVASDSDEGIGPGPGEGDGGGSSGPSDPGSSLTPSPGSPWLVLTGLGAALALRWSRRSR